MDGRRSACMVAGWVDFQQSTTRPLTSAGTSCPLPRVKQSGRVGLRGSTPQTCPMGWVAAAGARTPSTRPWRALAATASHKQGGRVRQALPQQPRVRESCLPACGIRVALSRSSLLACAVGSACVYVTARSPERFGGKVVLFCGHWAGTGPRRNVFALCGFDHGQISEKNFTFPIE